MPRPSPRGGILLPLVAFVIIVLCVVLAVSYWRASGPNQNGGFSKIETLPNGQR